MERSGGVKKNMSTDTTIQLTHEEMRSDLQRMYGKLATLREGSESRKKRLKELTHDLVQISLLFKRYAEELKSL